MAAGGWPGRDSTPQPSGLEPGASTAQINLDIFLIGPASPPPPLSCPSGATEGKENSTSTPFSLVKCMKIQSPLGHFRCSIENLILCFGRELETPCAGHNPQGTIRILLGPGLTATPGRCDGRAPRSLHGGQSPKSHRPLNLFSKAPGSLALPPRLHWAADPPARARQGLQPSPAWWKVATVD